jgi:hypothetical protein
MDSLDNIGQYPIYFAPGCKLQQLVPEKVSMLYDYLHKLFGNVRLYTRCCGLDDAREHSEEAVFITLCSSCFKVYGDTYANLHMRDFWDVYEEYKAIYPLDNVDELRAGLDADMEGPFPKAGLEQWYAHTNGKRK